MKVSIWDTYVKRENDAIMHFDILVPVDLKNEETIIKYGTSFLKAKSFNTGELTSKECKFCHIEQATIAIINEIQNKGFSIIEMENCD